jgi:hypothetical protein
MIDANRAAIHHSAVISGSQSGMTIKVLEHEIGGVAPMLASPLSQLVG